VYRQRAVLAFDFHKILNNTQTRTQHPDQDANGSQTAKQLIADSNAVAAPSIKLTCC